eukprot:309386-Hanusia_phi.AAC.4
MVVSKFDTRHYKSAIEYLKLASGQFSVNRVIAGHRHLAPGPGPPSPVTGGVTRRFGGSGPGRLTPGHCLRLAALAVSSRGAGRPKCDRAVTGQPHAAQTAGGPARLIKAY